jgi:hypothetical protein
MQIRSIATLAALLFAAAAPALAQQSVEVTAGHLSYHLIDLAPDDGIAPQLNWTSDSSLSTARLFDLQGNITDYIQSDNGSSIGLTDGSTSAHVDVQGDTSHIRVDAAGGYGEAYSDRGFFFTLSPHTQVVFDLDIDLWASVNPAADWLPNAMVTLDGSLQGNDWFFAVRAQTSGGSLHGPLSVSAVSQDAWVDGAVGYEAYAVAEAPALPVPEPAPAALLMGGLGVLAAWKRRLSW